MKIIICIWVVIASYFAINSNSNQEEILFEFNTLENKYLGREYQHRLQNIKDKEVGRLKKESTKNNSMSQCILGIMYEKGIRLPKNYTLATKWIERSALSGNSEAQYRLAKYYDTNIFKRGIFRKILNIFSIRKEFYLRAYWYEKAANQGHPLAQFQLGVLFSGTDYKGDITMNYNKAKFWLLEAQKNGIQEAGREIERVESIKDFLQRMQGAT
jgi:TPR repeat protein